MPVIRTLSGIKEYVLITGIFSMHLYRNESVSPKDVLITGIDCTPLERRYQKNGSQAKPASMQL